MPKHVVDSELRTVPARRLIGASIERSYRHPDLHLERCREVRIILTTHAVGGLSRSDFTVARLIDATHERTH